MNQHFEFFKKLAGTDNDEEIIGNTVAAYFSGIYNTLGEEKFFEMEYDNKIN